MTSKKGPSGWWVGVLVAVLAVIVLQPLASLWVRGEIQHRLKIRIEGDFRPVLFQPVFYLRGSRFELIDKIKLISGSLKVRYNLSSLFQPKNLLRVELSSQDIAAELLGSWSKVEGLKAIRLDRFYADLGLGSDGVEEIFAVDAESPTFQFHIKRSENHKGQLANPSRMVPT